MDERAIRTLEFGKVKEMLAAQAATSLGRELCEDITPAVDYLEVKHRLDETNESAKVYLKGQALPLGGIHDLRMSVQRALRGGMLDPGELLDVADTVSSGRRLRKFIQENETPLPILSAIANMIGAFPTLETEIRRAVTDHGEVADDASPALGQIRRAQRTYQGRIRDKMDSYLRGAAAKYLQEPIITIRDDRYCIPVKIEYRGQVPGIVHDQSQSGSTLFIEPMAVVEMNNEMKELALKERQEVARILARLSALVGEAADSLLDTMRGLAQIDFAAAKGKLAMQMNAIAPVLEREPMLEIKKGRHPLLKGEVVPANVTLGVGFDTLIITGPNTGGKTVTLKTMGLFVLMTQSGLFIPAAHGTRMGIFEQVFTDVGDEQSIEQSLSTFSSHMTNIVRILGEIDGPALVMMDELGAGTDPTEGAALAMSILEHLHARGAKTVVTSHYSELKTFAYTRPRVENASVEFDVQTLRPTYRLLIGVPGSSNAFEISRRLGLTNHVVDRARQFLTSEQERVEDLIAGIQATRTELEREKAEAQRLRAEAVALKSDYDKRFGGAENRAAEIMDKARAQAQQILSQARVESEAVIDELKAALKAQREAEATQSISSARKRLSGARQALDEQTARRRQPGEAPKGLKPGDTVQIISLGQTAHVLTEPDASNNVLVQAGIIKVTVPITDLARAEEEPQAPAKGARGGTRSHGRSAGFAKATTMSSELDLRGLMAEEALERLDKYLDDAVLAGIGQVRIIHGKGTGALRKAVTDHLKYHSSVASHRIGGVGEGGDGVTVARLRD